MPCCVVRLLQKCWEALLVIFQLSFLSSVPPNFHAINTWTFRTDKSGLGTNFAAVSSAETAHQTGMLRGKKKRNDFVFLVFLFFICSALVAKRHSLQTIWAKGCLCLCRVLVTLKVQVVKKRKELLLLDFYRKTQMLSSSRDPKVEFQHRLYGLAVGGLCRGNGIWMDLAVRNEAVGHPWIWAWAAAKESGSGNPSRIPWCPQKC